MAHHWRRDCTLGIDFLVFSHCIVTFLVFTADRLLILPDKSVNHPELVDPGNVYQPEVNLTY